MNKLSYALILLGIVMFFLPVLALAVTDPAGTSIISTFRVLIYHHNYVTVAQMILGVVAFIIGIIKEK